MARERLRVNREIADTLEEALVSLRSFLDPKDENCAVSPEIRGNFGLQSYLGAWVEPALTRALRSMDPEFHRREIDTDAEANTD